MSDIDGKAILIGFVVAVVVTMIVGIVVELWNHHKGARGDYEDEMNAAIARALAPTDDEWCKFETRLHKQAKSK